MDLQDDISEAPQSYLIKINADKFYIYDNLWFDISLVKSISLATKYESYKPETSWPKNLKNTSKHFSLTFQQGRDINAIAYCVTTFDTVVGRIGGYAALIWMVIGYLMSDYEGHKFQTSLIRNLYHCTEDGPEAPPSQTESTSKQALSKTIKNPERFQYFYYEFYLNWIVRTFFSCCCKNRKWYKNRMNRQKLFADA